VEKMAFETGRIISTTDAAFFEAGAVFSVSEKTVGGAPAAVFCLLPTTGKL
jgi:hypothetical protein